MIRYVVLIVALSATPGLSNDENPPQQSNRNLSPQYVKAQKRFEKVCSDLDQEIVSELQRRTERQHKDGGTSKGAMVGHAREWCKELGILHDYQECIGALVTLELTSKQTVIPSLAQEANAKVNKQIKAAVAAFKKTITSKRDPRRTLWHPRGSRRIVFRRNKRAVRQLAERYGIAEVFGTTLELALSAQFSLERYLDLLDLVRDHGAVLGQDKLLAAEVEKVREHGHQMFGRYQRLMAAVAYQIAKSHQDISGAGVCFVGVVEQAITIDGKRYVRLEEAGHSWLVRVPDGVRWTEKAVVFVIGRVVKDTDYTTVLGANRAATVVDPSIDSQ